MRLGLGLGIDRSGGGARAALALLDVPSVLWVGAPSIVSLSSSIVGRAWSLAINGVVAATGTGTGAAQAVSVTPTRAMAGASVAVELTGGGTPATATTHVYWYSEEASPLAVYDGLDAATFTEAGGLVTAWADVYSTHHLAAQIAGPVHTRSINGHAAIGYDATDDARRLQNTDAGFNWTEGHVFCEAAAATFGEYEGLLCAAPNKLVANNMGLVGTNATALWASASDTYGLNGLDPTVPGRSAPMAGAPGTAFVSFTAPAEDGITVCHDRNYGGREWRGACGDVAVYGAAQTPTARYRIAECAAARWLTTHRLVVQESDLSDAETRVERNPFARLVFTTTATELWVSWSCENAETAGQNRIAVYTDGVLTATLNPGTAIVDCCQRVTLAAGAKTVWIEDGSQRWLVGGISGNRVRHVHANAALTVTHPAAPARRIVVYGDSIANGFNAVSVTEAWNQLLRHGAYPGLITMGSGHLRLAYECDSAAKRTALLARMGPLFTGTSSNELWIALGTNDWSDGDSAATYAATYGAFLDALHAAYPAVTVYCQSPILRTSVPDPETVPNAGGSTLPDYRAALAAVAAARPTYCTYVDGLPFVAAGNLAADGIHPLAAGFVEYAADSAVVLA